MPQSAQTARGSLTELTSKLLSRPQATEGADQAFDEARLVLESLPLTTEEFATAINRLENARRYLQAGEHGAASSELRLMVRSLTSMETPLNNTWRA